MRHHNKNRKFGLERDQRAALMRSLAKSLIDNGKMRTTIAKAKEIRPYVEKLVTRAKSPTLHSRRLLLTRIGSASTVSKLIKDVAPKYEKRFGGYLRIAKIGIPRKDGSAMAIIEFV